MSVHVCLYACVCNGLTFDLINEGYLKSPFYYYTIYVTGRHMHESPSLSLCIYIYI